MNCEDRYGHDYNRFIEIYASMFVSEAAGEGCEGISTATIDRRSLQIGFFKLACFLLVPAMS
jgi:hypothetical protein